MLVYTNLKDLQNILNEKYLSVNTAVCRVLYQDAFFFLFTKIICLYKIQCLKCLLTGSE